MLLDDLVLALDLSSGMALELELILLLEMSLVLLEFGAGELSIFTDGAGSAVGNGVSSVFGVLGPTWGCF